MRAIRLRVKQYDAGKKATKIFVASDGMEKFFPKEKIMITGNPVRSSIAAFKTQQA
jgi:UDP-N-acetylglucosamine--N-acetylmuramyl-(pentapeptide) pyrophosphoryl-undecaprenol N-acetylglucosamine transferase